MSFLLHYTQNMGDCRSAPHISWANLSCLAHIFRLSISLVYDSLVVVKKSRHEKYLFLICFFKSGHDDSMPCKVLVCKGLLCLGAGNTPPVCVPDRLKAGDWVELPFGKDDLLRQGQVKAVMDCTRTVAPWPPEQTKTVIRVIDAPAVTPTAEVAAPRP